MWFLSHRREGGKTGSFSVSVGWRGGGGGGVMWIFIRPPREKLAFILPPPAVVHRRLRKLALRRRISNATAIIPTLSLSLLWVFLSLDFLHFSLDLEPGVTRRGGRLPLGKNSSWFFMKVQYELPYQLNKCYRRTSIKIEKLSVKRPKERYLEKKAVRISQYVAKS
jgi:hypothetical protein